jgi:transcriptional regulator
MHPTPIFTNHDKAAALAFAARCPFASVAVNGEGGPVTALVPLFYDAGKQCFLGHVARANPFWKAAKTEGVAAAIFRGPNAYISPSYYPSKAEHHKAVPTWNYMAAEIRGQITVAEDSANMAAFLAPLTDVMESGLKQPWKISDAPEDYIAKLSNAIVGFSLEAETITFVEKLSQNRPEADQRGVVIIFENSSCAAERDMAFEMKRFL